MIGWFENCVHLTDGGDDGATEEESIGQIPSAGVIWCASGIHTCFNGINHFLKRKDGLSRIPLNVYREWKNYTENT